MAKLPIHLPTRVLLHVMLHDMVWYIYMNI